MTDEPGQQDKPALYLRHSSDSPHEDRLLAEAERTAAGHRFLTIEHPAGDKALVDELLAEARRTERVHSIHRQEDELTIEIHPPTGTAKWARTADELVDALERLAHQLSSTWRTRRSAR